MNIRDIKESDIIEVNRLYDDFFSDNEYPNFLDRSKFHGPFAITTESNKIVLAGGIKTILEAVVITDQKRPVGMRQVALLQAMGCVIHIARDMGYTQVHAFVNNDEQYVKHLQKFGFRLIDSKLLVLDLEVPNG